jgi:small subunit ribosomal protein S20
VHERRRQRNAPLRSRAKTLVTKARQLVAEEDESAQGAVAEAIVALDKAATKGALHANNAARRKSRLMKLLNRSGAK